MSAAAELARRLAREAEAVCRCYLSRGHRHGHYWVVGDVQNTPGRSLYVRLQGADYGPGAAGKWTDAATGEHGDLLDLIHLNRNCRALGEAMDEARSFLAFPRPGYRGSDAWRPTLMMPELARRLFGEAYPVLGTAAERYLRARGITAGLECSCLRYHPACAYRQDRFSTWQPRPALLAAVTDLNGTITGIQRTWLDPTRAAKAAVAQPRRALGHLLGNAVRFDRAQDVLAAGEGIETMLSLKSVFPSLPMIAALSANHLAAVILPNALQRLYIARDNDAAGRNAAMRLRERAEAAGIECRDLLPLLKDFNLDLCRYGPVGMLAVVAEQMPASDIERFTRETP